MLPIDIQMQIDLSAQHHSREIAEGFAKLRAELGPKPHPSALRDMAYLQNMLMNNAWSAQTGGMRGSLFDGPFGPVCTGSPFVR